MKCDKRFPLWSDNWWIEDNEAWFVWGFQNILCCLDFETNECGLLTYVPDVSNSGFRENPMCIKYLDDIYCMPTYGRSIWVYSTVDKSFCEIKIDVPDEAVAGIYSFWAYCGKIYAVSIGLRQIIEIDPIEKKIAERYPVGKACSIVSSVKAASSIYTLSDETGEVCQFDLDMKETFAYKLPEIGRRFSGLCHDGENFWFSGYRKEIYVWDKDKNIIKTIDGFPEDFGIYDFTEGTDGKVHLVTEDQEIDTYYYLTVVGQNVWFIPGRTNKILYVDRETYKIQSFEIEEENETKESLLATGRLACKYLLEYVKDDRYLVLYSLKKQCILEIDTDEMKYAYRQYDYSLDDEFGEEYAKEYARRNDYIFSESNALEQKIYRKVIHMKNNEVHDGNVSCIGNKIYEKISYG